jgi:hypothetical protein
MKASPRFRSSAAAALVALAACGAATAHTSSTSSTSPTPQEQLRALQASINALAAQVTALSTQLTGTTNQVTDVKNLVAPPTALHTHALSKPAGYSAGCFVTNGGTAEIKVSATLRNLAGAGILTDIPFTLQPGQSNGVSLSLGSGPQFVSCGFRMVAGSSADLRANLAVFSETTGLETQVAEAR